MQTGISRFLAVLVLLAIIAYFYIEPGSMTVRDNAAQLRNSVREGVQDTRARLDNGFDAAKKDVETIKSDLKEGGRDEHEPESRHP